MIFDYGGVISLPQDPSFHRTVAGLARADARTLVRAYRAHRHDYDMGALTGRDYWRTVLEDAEAENTGLSVEELIRLDVQSWTRINPETLGLVTRLQAAGVALALLSNLPADHLVYFERRFQWLDLFPVRVFSCRLGRAKPDAEIYRHCLSRIDLPADRCLFVDDTEENVKAARTLGMEALRFDGARRLEADLRVRLDGTPF